MLIAIILAYFALLLGIAFYTSRGSDNESFFIGNRKSNWLLVSFGMIGTSLSGMTFISVPGTVASNGLDYFQVAIGYWIGYFVVAYILLPLYYKLNVTSIYTYLEDRLGVTAHKTGAFFFILSRTLGATLRLYLVIKVLEIFVLKDIGISFAMSAVVIMVLILLYTLRGGVKTIVWTDTLQTTFMLLALVICVVFLMNELGYSFATTWDIMKNKGYTNTFNTDIHSSKFMLKQIVGGAFITIAMTGLDQEMMQKNISVSNVKDAQKNMLLFGFVQMVVVFIFLLLGALLAIYAQEMNIAATGDNLFPTIAVQSGLPFFITVIFMIGLVSALFPSADGALTALTASYCLDIIGIQKKIEWSEEKKASVRKKVHLIFSVVFLLCIFFFKLIDNGSLISILLKVASFTYGPLLGLFAFGIFTKKKLSGAAIVLSCTIALLGTFIIDLINDSDKYFKSMVPNGSLELTIKSIAHSIFGDYKIGLELLIINATITFLAMLICSKSKK
jgi:SSS family transporter